MSEQHLRILCGSCKVDLEGRRDGDLEPDWFACPTCGVGDAKDNVLREAREYIEEMTVQKLDDRLIGGFGKGWKVTRKVGPKRVYRFITDDIAV